MNIIECPDCNGEKEVYYSCCTGEIERNDYHICPCCKEHLGLETCNTCDGKGTIEDKD